MIPFFSEAVLPHYTLVRPAWSLPLMGVCVLGHAATELSGFPEWRFVFDLPLGLAALYHSWAWGLRRSFEARMLAMLHIAFAWLAFALLLYALQSLALLAGEADLLGRARAARARYRFRRRPDGGHGFARDTRPLRPAARGRPSDLVWFSRAERRGAGARIDRVFAARRSLNAVAAAGWLACLLPWALRYAPFYLRSRADGRPG